METKLDIIPHPLNATLTKVPYELVEHIANYLEFHELNALASTCGFFSTLMKNQAFKDLKETKQVKPVAGTSCILFYNNKKLWVCGHNKFSQLGLGDNKNKYLANFVECKITLQPNEVITAITSYDHTLIKTNKNRLLVSGRNHGSLGLGDTQERNTFVECTIPLASDEFISEIIAGHVHSIIKTNKHRLLVSGHLDFIGDRYSKYYAFKEFKIQLQQGEVVEKIATGWHFTLVKTNQNRLLVCGNDAYGQLGLGEQAKREIETFVECPIKLHPGELITDIIAGNEHSFVKTNQHRLLTCGRNCEGQLGLGYFGETDSKNVKTFVECNVSLRQNEIITEIAAGHSHSLLKTNQNRLLSCGDNSHGQLGSEDFKSKNTFIECTIPLLPNETITTIAAGHEHSIVKTNQQRLFVCGYNFSGDFNFGKNIKQNKFTCLFDGQEKTVIQQNDTQQSVENSRWHK
jgi:alpha-tubulin suppressor-like RCC1 family protein